VIRVKLIYGREPAKAPKEVVIAGIPRHGDTVRDYEGGPRLRKVENIVWDIKSGEAEVWLS
jgi:hypothetical protein